MVCDAPVTCQVPCEMEEHEWRATRADELVEIIHPHDPWYNEKTSAQKKSEFRISILNDEAKHAEMATQVRNYHTAWDRDRRRSSLYSIDRRIDVQKFTETADQLLFSLGEYKKWVQTKQKEGSVSFRGSQVNLSHLPKYKLGYSLLPLFKKLHCTGDSFDHKNFEHLVTCMREMLAVLDSNAKIDGKLQQLYKTDSECQILTAAVVLMVIHPSSQELLEQEPEGAKDRESLLAQKAKFGQNFKLNEALDAMLERRILKRFKVHEYRPMPPIDILMHEVWQELDRDAIGKTDDNLPQSEKQALLRHVLQSPILGLRLLSRVVGQPINESWAMFGDPATLNDMIFSLPELFKMVAKDIEVHSDRLWQKMDKDKNGSLSEAEFSARFPKALRKIILNPMRAQLTKSIHQTGLSGFQEPIVIQGLFSAQRITPELKKRSTMLDDAEDDEYCCFSCGRKKIMQGYKAESDSDEDDEASRSPSPRAPPQ